MNEQAEQILARMIERIMNGVDKAADFAAEEIPVVIEQLLTWHFVESMIWFIVAILMVVGYIYGIRKWFAYCKVEIEKDEEMIPVKWTVTMFSTLASVLLIVAVGSIDWLKIWVAPKLYLLEYGASLVK